jgi:hypothetical protein
MQPDQFISRIMDDEGITDGLADPEARLLIEWLVEQAEGIAANSVEENAAWKEIEALCRRARSIRQFVALWCHREDHAAATQLAGAEKLDWTLPSPDCNDPFEVLQQILVWEHNHSPIPAARGQGKPVNYEHTPAEY